MIEAPYFTNNTRFTREQVSRNYHFTAWCTVSKRLSGWNVERIITVSLKLRNAKGKRKGQSRFTVGVQFWRWLVDYKVYPPRFCFHFVTVHSLIMLPASGTTKTLFPWTRRQKINGTRRDALVCTAFAYSPVNYARWRSNV